MSTTQNSDVPEPDPMSIDPTNLGSVDPLSVEGIFLVALSKTGAEREAFLSAQCSDLSQRQRVEALLLAYEQAGDFLQKPAVTTEPTLIGQYLAPCELPGTLGRLGPYEILEEIGRGGMGVVFRAHDPKLQRIVAVKVLAPELARLPSARQRFLREARAAAAISHPHVVTIFAVDGTEEASLGTERTTLPYLVMECVVGQTLHDKIKRVGALRVEEIVRISRQMAEGLGAAHKRGLIHRDIKPANILLENGVERVKITDFGLARMTSDGGITHTGEILGTPQCMSPEQARGEIVDQRSDLFSLGCVMYTMCTGVSPFRADNMLAVMKKVCEVTPRPIAQLNPEVPEWLCSLVHQLLEKEPERRVQTAAEVVEALEVRAVASGPRPLLASADRKTATSAHPDAEAIPKWVVTPIVPNWIREWQGDAFEIGMLSLLLGTVNNHIFRDEFVTFLETLYMGVLFWAGAVLCQPLVGRQRWIRWPVFGASIAGLAAGGILGAAINQVFRSYPAEMAVLIGLLVATGLLVARWLTRPWNQVNSKTNSDSAETPPREFHRPSQPRSPWSVLGWMLVAMLGVVMIGGGLVFFAITIPAYITVQASRTDEPGMSYGIVLLNFPAGENVKTVTIDGQGVILRPGAENQWSMHAAPGPHTLYVDFSTDSALNQVKTYKTTINVTAGKVIDVEAVPVVESMSPNNELTLPDQDSKSAAGAEMTEAGAPVLLRPEASITAIPLADAVEVLTDAAQMPAPAMALGGLGTMTQAVWIDEPGLLIRMKRLGFDGNERAEIEYDSTVAWGTGPFMGTNSLGEHAYEFPTGRYQVLVQDLDYGWPLDRRGTITIGNGATYVHVKRSFDSHQLHSDGTTQFPIPFRWTGKTYQIHNQEDISIVNSLLAATNSVNPVPFTTPHSFRQHPLFQNAVATDPSGRHLLKRERTLAQIDIQSADMLAGFMSPLGSLEFNRLHKSPGDVFVPRQELRMFVKDELIGWETPGWYDNRPIATDDALSTPFVVRRDRALIRTFAESNLTESPAVNFWFFWFGTSTDLPRKSAPAVRGLITAWADGQPEVPEAELLQLGGATSLEDLWKLPAPVASPDPVLYSRDAAAAAPTNENAESNTDEPNTDEPNTDEPKPEFVPPAFLVPGSTPGTWRMKEPPEGVVAS